jgi:hypothetical protein
MAHHAEELLCLEAIAPYPRPCGRFPSGSVPQYGLTMAIDIEKALEKIRQYEASNPTHQETPAKYCRGCGIKIRMGADAADGLCVGGGTYPVPPDLSDDCASRFTLWLLAHEDLGPKVLARTMTSAERLIAIDEWLTSK